MSEGSHDFMCMNWQLLKVLTSRFCACHPDAGGHVYIHEYGQKFFAETGLDARKKPFQKEDIINSMTQNGRTSGMLELLWHSSQPWSREGPN